MLALMLRAFYTECYVKVEVRKAEAIVLGVLSASCVRGRGLIIMGVRILVEVKSWCFCRQSPAILVCDEWPKLFCHC